MKIVSGIAFDASAGFIGRVTDCIDRYFSPGEAARLRGCGLKICLVPLDSCAEGIYLRAQNAIMFNSACYLGNETIVHELVHALRNIGGRYAEAVEESIAVAETVARTSVPSGSIYYGLIQFRDPVSGVIRLPTEEEADCMAREDCRALAVGRKTGRSVAQLWPETNISKMAGGNQFIPGFPSEYNVLFNSSRKGVLYEPKILVLVDEAGNPASLDSGRDREFLIVASLYKNSTKLIDIANKYSR